MAVERGVLVKAVEVCDRREGVGMYSVASWRLINNAGSEEKFILFSFSHNFVFVEWCHCEWLQTDYNCSLSHIDIHEDTTTKFRN